MANRREIGIFAAMVGAFLAATFVPITRPEVASAWVEAFRLLQWYARNHTLACVVPAIFIAGAITTFLSQASVMRHLGPGAPRMKAYGVASVAGVVIAVCSCSVLPIFAGIYQLGAGLGPASAFLYSGPAINVMAILLTARVLGLELGAARAIGAILFAFLVGLGMALAFRREERDRTATAVRMPTDDGPGHPLWQTGLFLVAMVLFLVFSDWFDPGDAVVHLDDGSSLRGVVLQETTGDWTVQLQEAGPRGAAGENVVLPKDIVRAIETPRSWVMAIHRLRWLLAGLMGLAVALMAWRWFSRDELRAWMSSSWQFAKLIVPLLFGGVFVVGFLAALLPNAAVASWVGGNDLGSVLVGSVVGALFYFATLTEVPIVQALTEHGMAQGPALALLLAGPALSLPNILVIGRVIGWRKTTVFCLLVVCMATVAGVVYGAAVGG